MGIDQLFEPFGIELEKDGRSYFATVCGHTRAAKLAISADEYSELQGLLEANPEQTFEVWLAFQAQRQGKGGYIDLPDGSLQFKFTGDVDLYGDVAR
ncbi:hypothetical protein ABFT80_23905 [Mesorhizobium sp. SB112]|uniref:hypothetical protein n=1 Tax=Mesorhizobium sp. SB112 TaxID=3151853 RepID=UPI003266A118